MRGSHSGPSSPCHISSTEDVHIAVQRVTVVAVADDFCDALCLAAHVVEAGEELEIPESVDCQHSTFSFSTSSLSPW